MPKINTLAFKRLMKFVKEYNKQTNEAWHRIWYDKHSDSDVNGKPDKDVKDLILRQDIRWAIADFAELHKDNPEKVDQLFINIYLQITGSDLCSEGFKSKFNLLPIIFPGKKKCPYCHWNIETE